MFRQIPGEARDPVGKHPNSPVRDFGSGVPLGLIATGDGVVLLLGLGTPFAAAVQVLIEGWLGFAGGAFNLDHGARALMGLALMMLGPGQYSVDRRLYGRKRIELGRSQQ